ncbi:beta-mannosidase [Nylanderia fulva]|uniref:beta-mannosidase n=1 Tax=Nylanderia fulva TaxID=613905 RepID=UPI0010FB617A|nr:beta-mannosidase [Nylanderia fulva]
MEREKNERLSARKFEEEEMKRKLTNIGIYEPELTYKQMKELLGFINEPQDTLNVISNNKDTHKEQHINNQHLSEITSDVNASQELALQECTEIPRPSYSYRSNHISSTEHKTSHYVNDPESPSLFEARNPMYRRKSSDNEEIFESTNSTHSTNRFLSLRSTNVSRESQNATDKKTAQDTSSELDQKLDRWQMNPLDVCINEIDVPLQQPNRTSAKERVPFKYCEETHTTEQRDQAIRCVSQHLQKVAESWYNWQPAANSIFRWGSPIQVGTANGSLDKKPLTESKTEQMKTECTYRDSHERASKRKASSLIASLNKESSTEDEDDKWHDFARIKKKRAQFDSKSSNAQRAVNRHHSNNHEEATSSVIAHQGNSIDDENSDIEFNDDDIKSLCRKKINEEDKREYKEDKEDISMASNIYPRRIVPPNPKARPGLSRQRKGTAKSSSKTRRIVNKVIEHPKMQKDTMTDDEIQKMVESWNSDEEEISVEKHPEIRPLPLSKEVRSKLHEKRLSLHKIETVKETNAATKEEESDRERNKEKRPKLCERKKEESRMKNGNGSWEHQLLSDDEDKPDETNQELDVQNGNQSDKVFTSTNNVSCPICNKLFPDNEIENHAAYCEQFDTNNEEDDNDKNKLECSICNNYKTTDGIEYEEHVHQCISRRDKRHSRGSQDIDTAPASSFHTYKPVIDEQKDSEIAYLGHFPSDNKTNKLKKLNTNRKRKLYTEKLPHTLMLQYTSATVIKMKLFILTLWILSLISVHCQSITLNGEWKGTINTCDKKPFPGCDNDINFSATVPGGVYTDLSKNNIIENNLFGRNDINNRWVGNQSVVYTKNVNVTSDFLRTRKTVLIFYGIDTFANVSLNDHMIGQTSNMFLRYIFDVTDYIKEGQNLLRVAFRSSVKVAEDLYNEHRKSYVVPPVCVPKDYHGQCHVNHIRKMQASFSWDWGPAFPSVGIWRDVELVSVNDLLLKDVTTDIRREKDTWNVLVTIFLEMTQNENEELINCHVTSILHVSQSILYSNTSEIMLDTSKKYMNINISLTVPAYAVENWWPNGYGKQPLYYLTTTLTTANDVLHKRIRVGFRTIELVEEPLEKGLSFYFRVNDVPIFAKGSNFIPASVFPEWGAKENTIRHLLLSAKETHMNMLRVWGGGVYESKLFYDLADEYGIMIWQDFMFACAMYPTDDSFLKNVEQEIVQNVIRLKNHPSIVLWAGNNENEAALYGDWYGTGTAQVYRDDYRKLYVNLIKREVEKLDPGRLFVVSSPGNGVYEETYNYTGANPYSNLFGDVHYYNYLRNGWDITQYPRTRFCSEYGFQSWPSMYTLVTAVESAKDLNVGSDFVQHRQHLPFGNEYMRLLISYNFAMPQSNNSVRDFANYVYLSQINQAVSMRIQTEAYRQAKSEVNNVTGEGMTMGALYWQLNDVWQAPSWSSIDIEGRWKMLHYYAKDFFAPIIVTSHLSTSNELSIYVVSDLRYGSKNCTVEICVYNWNSTTPIFTKSFDDITIEANEAKRITSFLLDDFLVQVCGSLESAKKSCIITLSLTDIADSLIAVNYVYPGALKNANVPVANVTIKLEEDHLLPGKLSNYPDFKIELSTDNIALFVWLEVGNIRGRFSENGFHMFEKKKEIIFHAYEGTTIELLRSNIRLVTLSDIYNARGNFHDDYFVKETKNLY